MSSRTGVSAAVVTLLAALMVAGASGRPSGSVESTPRFSRVPLQPAARRPIHLVIGDRLKLPRVVSRLAAVSAVYASSNPRVATVTESGEVHALGRGTATITATVGATPGAVETVPFMVMTDTQAVNLMINELCPNVDERQFVDSAWIKSDVPLVHEYHDCQRLIQAGNGGTLEYGPLVGILAHRNVANYQRAVDYDRGRLAALIVNFASAKGRSRYGPLLIEPGTNCLILRSTGKGGWEAAIIPQKNRFIVGGQRRYGTCDDSLRWRDVPPARRGRLGVSVQHARDPRGGSLVPAVARWDWDSLHATNYIGVKCGVDSWCEIGPSNLAPSLALRNSRGQFLIKGYYDEQYLATDSGQRPSNVFGTLMPGANAGDTLMRIPGTNWYHVSDMTMRVAPRAFAQSPQAMRNYVRKFHLVLHPISATYPIPTATGDVRINRPLSPPAAFGFGDYGVKINGQLEPAWLMQYRSHPSEQNKLATVRWRWEARDESHWTYCDPDGCCEHRGTFQF